MGRLAVLVVVAIVGLCIPIEQAGATSPRVSITSCGQVINTDAVLRTDLVCSGDALIVEGSNLNVRLGGHTISSSDGSGVGVQLGVETNCAAGICVPGVCVNNVVVRDGTISGFLDAIMGNGGCSGPGPSTPPSAAISKMRLTGNTWGLYLTDGFPVSVDHTTIVGPNGIRPSCNGCWNGQVNLSHSAIDVTSVGGTSVAYYFDSPPGIDRIESSRLDGGTLTNVSNGDFLISHSQLNGVNIECGDAGFAISHSRLVDTILSDTTDCSSTLTNDRVTGPGSGTFVRLLSFNFGASITNTVFTDWDTAVQIAGANDANITGNTFRHNGTGVACTERSCIGGTVSGNRFIANTGTGLLLTTGTWHVGSNIALRNGGLGIDAEGTQLTVIDDGGNIARRNQPPQCIGVVCTRHPDT